MSSAGDKALENFDGQTIRVPVKAGVVYKINGQQVTGEVTIHQDTTLTAEPAQGFSFPEGTTTGWDFVVNRDEDNNVPDEG